jgi:hypothetical protein
MQSIWQLGKLTGSTLLFLILRCGVAVDPLLTILSHSRQNQDQRPVAGRLLAGQTESWR